jgi:hypothetical protein
MQDHGSKLRRIPLLRGWVHKATTTVLRMGWLGLSQLLILLLPRRQPQRPLPRLVFHLVGMYGCLHSVLEKQRAHSAPNEECPLLPAVSPGRDSGGSQGIVLAHLALP